MFHTRPLDYDPLTGTTETFHFDPYENTMVIEQSSDPTSMLDENKIFMNDAESDWRGDVHRVASIPMIILPELEKRHIMTLGGRIMDQQALKRFLNDRDNLWLRTRPGRV